jgi:hypothetical protein
MHQAFRQHVVDVVDLPPAIIMYDATPPGI